MAAQLKETDALDNTKKFAADGRFSVSGFPIAPSDKVAKGDSVQSKVMRDDEKTVRGRRSK